MNHSTVLHLPTQTSCGESHKGSAYLLENMKDPLTAYSEEVNNAPFQRALRTEMTHWEWFDHHPYERRRFEVAMKGVASLEPPNIIADGDFNAREFFKSLLIIF